MTPNVLHSQEHILGMMQHNRIDKHLKRSIYRYTYLYKYKYVYIYIYRYIYIHTYIKKQCKSSWDEGISKDMLMIYYAYWLPYGWCKQVLLY